MGQILSQSEVEAILSAVDFSVPKSPSSKTEAAAEATLYDFEHPVPLRPATLESLRLAYASTAQSLQSTLGTVLRSAVTVNFLAVEQSTFRDYLTTCETPTCLAVLNSESWTHCCLLDLSRSLAYAIIDRMLGGRLSDSRQPVTMARPFTEVESRVIAKTLQVVLPDLLGQLSEQNSVRLTRIVSDGSLLGDMASNEAVALVSFEVICGTVQALMQLCVPWKQVSQNSVSAPVDAEQLRDRWRSGAIKVPVIATARIASIKLTARQLASLSPGDVLLTDVLTTGELSLDIDEHEIFRGTPGQCHERKVIRLTTAVAQARPGGR